MVSKIFQVAIHDLKKSNAKFTCVLGKKHLQISPTVQRVVQDLHSLYGRRSTKSHGKFSSDTINFPTQNMLQEYLGTHGDFGILTASLMQTLVVQADRKPSALGGHVFFAHFEDGPKQFVMIALVNDRLNAALTQDHDVRDVTTLDLEGFRFGGRVNLTAWSNGEERYLSFLKGKGDVADYFKEFLGCDTMFQDREDTYTLVAALKEFTELRKIQGQDRDDFLAKAKSICDQSAKKREEISLAAFANELFPTDPESLLKVLTDDSRQLNDGFVPDKRALGTLVRFKAKTPHWAIEFDREAITSGKIRYSDEDNTLTLSDIPSELAAQLRTQGRD